MNSMESAKLAELKKAYRCVSDILQCKHPDNNTTIVMEEDSVLNNPEAVRYISCILQLLKDYIYFIQPKNKDKQSFLWELAKQNYSYGEDKSITSLSKQIIKDTNSLESDKKLSKAINWWLIKQDLIEENFLSKCGYKLRRKPTEKGKRYYDIKVKKDKYKNEYPIFGQQAQELIINNLDNILSVVLDENIEKIKKESLDELPACISYLRHLTEGRNPITGKLLEGETVFSNQFVLDNMNFIKDLLEEILKDSEYVNIRNETKKFFKNYADVFCKLNKLLEKKEYISSREYNPLICKVKQSPIIRTIRKDNNFDDDCRGKILRKQILDGIDFIDKYRTLVEKHNDDYIATELKTKEKILDELLKELDPPIKLDEEQKRVVLTDEDYCLVIAGPGTGKTATIAAKVKYLVDVKGINPNHILVMSFTNKAVEEVGVRIKGILEKPKKCHIYTFHKMGKKIIEDNENNSIFKKLIVDDTKRHAIIRKYFRYSIMKDENRVNSLKLFFKDYFSKTFKESELHDYLNYVKYRLCGGEQVSFKNEFKKIRGSKQTIKDEWLKSKAEVDIANFLYLNNIDYEYEPVYKPCPVISDSDIYTPDFIIWQGEKGRNDNNLCYIEHFGMIDENGDNFMQTQEDTEDYKKKKRDKEKHHETYKTKLIETVSYTDGSLLKHLKEKLEKEGFVLNPRPDKEIMEMLIACEENRCIYRLVKFVCRFISLFKVKAYSEQQFDTWCSEADMSERDKLFLGICKDCFQAYQKWLENNNAIDFEDMINNANKSLKGQETLLNLKPYSTFNKLKYVIVDEYQDISWQRFDFIKNISDITGAKILAVGDDWQSIYAFSGSESSLFTNFEDKMGYAKKIQLKTSYRNSQRLLDITKAFMEQNSKQSKNELKSVKKEIVEPIQIYTYVANKSDKTASAFAEVVEKVLSAISNYMDIDKTEPGKILLLGRYRYENNNDLKSLIKTERFRFISHDKSDDNSGIIRSDRFPELKISFMTVHAAKGLEYDNVIVINGEDDTYGFPCKVEDDSVLRHLFKDNGLTETMVEYPEERRLLYVAMTRTKNRVFFIAPQQNPSMFLRELQQLEGVKLVGEGFSFNKENSTCIESNYIEDGNIFEDLQDEMRGDIFTTRKNDFE